MSSDGREGCRVRCCEGLLFLLSRRLSDLLLRKRYAKLLANDEADDAVFGVSDELVDAGVFGGVSFSIMSVSDGSPRKPVPALIVQSVGRSNNIALSRLTDPSVSERAEHADVPR